MKVNSNRFNFQEIYDKYLTNYLYGDVVPALDEAVTEVSKEAVQRLKAASRENFGNGDYAKGWSREREKGRMKVGYTIYNKIPGLPHLLEKSHALRDGGRSTPKVHIDPVEQWAIEEATERFMHKVEGV